MKYFGKRWLKNFAYEKINLCKIVVFKNYQRGAGVETLQIDYDNFSKTAYVRTTYFYTNDKLNGFAIHIEIYKCVSIEPEERLSYDIYTENGERIFHSDEADEQSLKINYIR